MMITVEFMFGLMEHVHIEPLAADGVVLVLRIGSTGASYLVRVWMGETVHELWFMEEELSAIAGHG